MLYGVCAVYLQINHNGHTDVELVKNACKAHGVPFELVTPQRRAQLKTLARALAESRQQHQACEDRQATVKRGCWLKAGSSMSQAETDMDSKARNLMNNGLRMAELQMLHLLASCHDGGCLLR